ncbi:MAG: M23 family metallopeptidase [Chitinophagaceae bacterium]|nr:M23 family metallopeptidase [Chitinophagaceae bacterium]
MKNSLLLILLTIVVASCSVSSNPLRTRIKELQKGKLQDDTSFIYQLPFEPGKKRLIVQGYFGAFSHKERAALDFKMPKRTKVLAARDGVVIRLREDGDKGGLKSEYRQYGNFVVLQHADNSRSGYWHLQKDGVLVNVGDTVKQGQHIAWSGNTGYTAFPHLHFIVWTSAANGQWQQVATRFQTKRGVRYLRAWNWYGAKKK